MENGELLVMELREILKLEVRLLTQLKTSVEWELILNYGQ